jgi:hypothetical protein
MLRPSLVALFYLALATTSYANPLASQVSLETDGTAHTTDGWDYVDCGTYQLVLSLFPLMPNYVFRLYG